MSKSTGFKMYRKPGIMPHSGQIYGDLPYERRFLNALRCGLSVTRACIEAEVAFSTVHSWRSHDPEFKARWDEAREQGTDFLEIATERAIAGSNKSATGLPKRTPRALALAFPIRNGLALGSGAGLVA
jgi:hypothetical protein